MPDEGSDMRRRDQMHDTKQKKQQPASPEEPNASRCGHCKTSQGPIILPNENKINCGVAKCSPIAWLGLARGVEQRDSPLSVHLLKNRAFQLFPFATPVLLVRYL